MGEVPIDRGWAWCVLGGAFINTFFVIGGMKSMGIIFVQVVEHFQASPALVGWMIGLMSFGLSIFAPIVTAIGIRYTYRIVVIIGGVIMALGYFLAAFAPNIYFVIAIMGTFLGVANGFQFTPSMIMVGQYFNRYRSIAMAIVLAGGSVGQLIIPVLMRYLLDEMNFHGCCLIYSALVLHCVAGGLLLRPQSYFKKEKTSKTDSINNPDVKSQDFKNCNDDGAMTQAVSPHPSDDVNVTPSPSLNSLTFKTEIQHNLTSTPLVCSDKVPAPCQDIELTQNCTVRNIKKSVTGEDLCTSNPSLDIDNTVNNDTDLASEIEHLKNSQIENELKKKDVSTERETKSKVSACNKTCNPFALLFERSVVTSCSFWVYNVAICFANAGYLCQFFVLPSYAKEIDISKKQIAWILAISGSVDLVGRILGGILNNLRIIKTGIFVSISLLMTAGSVMICLFFPSFSSVLAHSIILGFLGGMYIALYPVALVDAMGLERFPKAFSLMVMCMGLLVLPLPTIFGLIFDQVGSFLPSLWICVLMMATGGIVVLFEPLACRLDEKRHIYTFPSPDEKDVVT